MRVFGRNFVAALLIASVCFCCEGRTQTKAASAAPGSFVEVDGSKSYYEECGTGSPTVVLIHDGVVNSAVWDDVWHEFCRRFRMIRYDRRGCGRSPAASTWYSETSD